MSHWTIASLYSLNIVVILRIMFLFQHFKLLVEELHVKGEAKIKNAMKESFKILNEVCDPLCPCQLSCYTNTHTNVSIRIEMIGFQY